MVVPGRHEFAIASQSRRLAGFGPRDKVISAARGHLLLTAAGAGPTRTLAAQKQAPAVTWGLILHWVARTD